CARVRASGVYYFSSSCLSSVSFSLPRHLPFVLLPSPSLHPWYPYPLLSYIHKANELSPVQLHQIPIVRTHPGRYARGHGERVDCWAGETGKREA
ncbi:hypothetical protein BDQ17DRAFT_1367159, partial [Cyathus striatus]